MNSLTAAQELVEYIVTSLVDFPEQVSVRSSAEGNLLKLTVSVAESDMGRVIGKGGRVVESIRTLLQVLGTKEGKRVSLEIT